jgi:hypothetical protein
MKCLAKEAINSMQNLPKKEVTWSAVIKTVGRSLPKPLGLTSHQNSGHGNIRFDIGSVGVCSCIDSSLIISPLSAMGMFALAIISWKYVMCFFNFTGVTAEFSLGLRGHFELEFLNNVGPVKTLRSLTNELNASFIMRRT